MVVAVDGYADVPLVGHECLIASLDQAPVSGHQENADALLHRRRPRTAIGS